jgi:chromosome partitioning protein
MTATARGHVIVVGNAKGGSGKSTTAMHVAVRLLNLGHSVGAIDLDGRQQTLTRYMDNRHAYAEAHQLSLPMPHFDTVLPSSALDVQLAQRQERGRFCELLERLVHTCDYVLVDCPGSDNDLARMGHAVADTLITPVNDSFIDVDLLARIDAETHAVLHPSWYSEMVWELRKQRFAQHRQAIDWVVMRNRLSQTDARNKRQMQQVLDTLAPRIGFRHTPGLGERVVYRELFLKGLTLSDLHHKSIGVGLTMNHVAAHQEVRDLLAHLRLPRPARQSAPLQRAG